MKIETLMRKIARRPGCGRVVVMLTESGNFVAHVFPTRERARQLVLANLPNESIPLDAITRAIETRYEEAFAFGKGNTVEDALLDLIGDDR